MPTTVSVDVYARDRASNTFDKVGSAAHRSGGLVGKFGTTVAGVFTGAALWNGAERLVTAMGDMMQGAADDEVAADRMALAYRRNADATKAQIAASEDWITTQGKALGIADDELRPALTRLVAVTHNVKDAQDDVALALDTSAGSGKGFNSVVDAMVKGENGLTSGFSRMGVETKNAAGEAKSFDDISKDLAKTWGGQASEAADTAAGRYKRLQVQFGETGEAIGYKLLPYANDFGSWMLDEGLPAAQDLGHWLADELGPTVQDLGGWFRDNKDDLEDFAKVALEDVIGGLETLVGIGRGAVDLFDSLPGPVKQFSGEIAFAALVVPRLTSALGLMKLQDFIGNMGTAESRTKAFGQAAKTAAGVAGVAALIDSTHQGNDAIGALEETLGGAAVGGSMFGPWGALAGGVLGGLHSAFGIMFDDVEQTGTVLTSGKAPVQDYASTFDGVTGAITGATRASILNAAEMSGAAGQARSFGISTRTLVNAVLGQRNALDAVDVALAKTSSLTISYTDAWGGHHDMAVRSNKQAKALTATLVEQGNTIDEVRSSELDLAGSKAVLDFIGKQSREWKAQSAEQRIAILAAEDMTSVYKNFPKLVATKIDAVGVVPTARGVADLAIKYDAVDKRHLNALIKATGADISAGQVQNLINKINAVHDKTVTITYHQSGSPNRPSDADVAGGSGRVGKGYHPRGSSSSSFGSAFLDDAGAQLLSGLVRGIGKGGKAVDAILTAVQDNVQTKLDKLTSDQDAYNQVVAGFDWRTSVFGMHSGDDTGPLTVQQILAQAAGEKAKAAQVDTDVQKLLSMGLSQDLIDQMRNQGADGIEAMHTLAGASQDQINQLIADNQTAQASYAHAGQVVAGQMYNAQIAADNQALAVAQQVQTAVDALKEWGDTVKFVLRGDTLVAVMDREKKHHPDR